jgi:large subunit ribosomal protein L5
MNEQNKMREILIDKVVLNVGTGPDQQKIEKAKLLLQKLTNRKPVETEAKKRVEEWGIRPGLKIGVAVTLRGKAAEEMLKRALAAVENKLPRSKIGNGTFSFGISEYVHIPGADYDPRIGIIGLGVAVALKRRGYRIAKKKIKRSEIGKHHLITKEETEEYLRNKFNVKIE